MHVLARDVLIEADFEGVVCGVDDTTDRLSLNRYTAALTAWEWLQREEHLFGAFEIAHHRPKARPNSVCVVHPKTGEEAWWPLFDETGKELFPELMPELDAIKELRAAGRHRSARQLPTYAKRTRKQLIAGVQKRRAERTKPAALSE